MNAAYTIAKNTFRETIRDRILYGILGFALLYLLLDLFFAKLALGDISMVKNFGLAGIYVFGLMITIFLGSSIIYKEIESRTLYFILSKPVSRAQVIIGKFAGLLGAITLTMLFMALLYVGVIAYEGGTFDYLGLLAIFLQLFEMGLFVALLIFFSSIASPLTATISAAMLLFTGHLLGAMLANASQMGGIALKFATIAYYLLPNLEKFNVRNLVTHQVAVSGEVLLATVAYACVYAGVLLTLAIVCFKRREL